MKKRKTHYSGARLKRLRERLGMSQKQFAIKVELDQATISRWENEEQKINIAYARLFFGYENENCIDLSKAGV